MRTTYTSTLISYYNIIKVSTGKLQCLSGIIVKKLINYHLDRKHSTRTQTACHEEKKWTFAWNMQL